MCSPAMPVHSAIRDRRAVIGWILYDLTSFIFALNIASLYFPLWVVDDAGGRDAHFGIANSTAMAIVFFAAPVIGIASDRNGRRMRWLTLTTLLSAACVALLGRGGLEASLLLYVLANATIGCGLVLYDALLPVVSTAENRGRVSGIGIGVGYLGSLLGIGLGAVILAADSSGKPLVFIATAIAMVVFAIPCLLWVKDPRGRGEQNPVNIRSVVRLLRTSVGDAWRIPGMARFLAGRVLYSDAANTLFAFMGIYATKEVGFSDGQTQIVLASGIIAGPFGAIGAGRMADRIGPQRTLMRLIGIWVGVLTACAAIPLFSLPLDLFWLVAPLGGIAFGGTITVDRALLFRLAPLDKAGQVSGVFAMVGRFATIIGPLMWAAIVDGLHLGRPIAMATLASLAAISTLFIWRIRDDRPSE